MDKLELKYKLWLETEEGYVIGQGSFELLQGIKEKGTLSGAVKALGMSYRHAWGIIKQIEQQIGKSILETHKGGKFGGGSAKLTQTGRELMETYLRIKRTFDHLCTNWKDET